MATAFTELAGCELPIQQAPVGYPAAQPELPIVVAAAGGHGMLAGVRMPADDLAERLRRIARHRIEPLADDAAIEAAAANAPLVGLYLGDPTATAIERARSGGALVSWQVISGEEARSAEAARFSPDNAPLDATGHVDAMALYAGQAVGSVRRREPAASIVADLAARLGGRAG